LFWGLNPSEQITFYLATFTFEVVILTFYQLELEFTNSPLISERSSSGARGLSRIHLDTSTDLFQNGFSENLPKLSSENSLANLKRARRRKRVSIPYLESTLISPFINCLQSLNGDLAALVKKV
jgi:hypothetical protein